MHWAKCLRDKTSYYLRAKRILVTFLPLKRNVTVTTQLLWCDFDMWRKGIPHSLTKKTMNTPFFDKKNHNLSSIKSVPRSKTIKQKSYLYMPRFLGPRDGRFQCLRVVAFKSAGWSLLVPRNGSFLLITCWNKKSNWDILFMKLKQNI